MASRQRVSFSLSVSNAISKSFPSWKSFRLLLKEASQAVLASEHGSITSLKLGIVLLNDNELLEMNTQVLGHDYYTDILTFEIERNSDTLEAELYISMDRAKENALRYKVSLRNELARLAIHGMLHLAGYDDKSTQAKNKMRKKERAYLDMLQSL
ncbi:MAG: rRNA maturation RNase YbeY [bacterium]